MFHRSWRISVVQEETKASFYDGCEVVSLMIENINNSSISSIISNIFFIYLMIAMQLPGCDPTWLQIAMVACKKNGDNLTSVWKASGWLDITGYHIAEHIHLPSWPELGPPSCIDQSVTPLFPLPQICHWVKLALSMESCLGDAHGPHCGFIVLWADLWPSECT